ncbi:cell wall biogenesis protein [Globomyces sp. JEL0801]|nr:cell wall biogenesis protein [Globomyces sp. JEL0801]
MGATESKLAFRKQVFSLSEQSDTPFDDDFWSTFYSLPESAEDVFNLCAHKDIRAAIEKNPKNIKSLIEKLMSRIQLMIDNVHPPTIMDCKHVLNCCRILTRVLPFIFESDTEDLENEIFWSETNLGPQLCVLVSSLLFYRGFTIPSGNSETSNVQFIIWNKGIGASTAPPASKDEIIRRTEVLRLLITLLSKTMYISSANVLTTDNLWMKEFTMNLEKKAILGMLCSFVNTIVTYDPIGWATLPYNHLLFGDLSEPLVGLCSQCLVALFDYRSNIPSEGGSQVSLSAEPSTTVNPVGKNLFAFYFSKLHKKEDLDLLVNGLMRLIRNPIDASKAYLPGSTKTINLTADLFLVIWTFIEVNKKFFAHLCQSPLVLVLVQALIMESLDARMSASNFLQLTNPDKIGLLHRDFGIRLNTEADISSLGAHGKLFPVFTTGCWGDILYLFIYVLLTTNSAIRASILHLQESYLATMANVSPLITKFNATTATKLFALFTVFSSPRFLLSKERNHTRLLYLLYTIDTILQYQYAGNHQIVYTFVRNKDKVLQLRDLELSDAIEQVQKLKQLKEEQEKSAEEELSEKAKGKLPIDQTAEFQSINGFKPTLPWFNEWKNRLPIQVLSTLVQKLGPQIEAFCIEHDLNVDTKVMEYLSAQTMVGVLPQPHPIITHSFIYSNSMHIWGSFYMKSVETNNAEIAKLCPSIWAGTKVKLFGVSIQ